MKEINKCRAGSSSWLGKSNIKISVIPYLIYRSNVTLITIQHVNCGLLTDLKVQRKSKGPKQPQNIKEINNDKIKVQGLDNT